MTILLFAFSAALLVTAFPAIDEKPAPGKDADAQTPPPSPLAAVRRPVLRAEPDQAPAENHKAPESFKSAAEIHDAYMKILSGKATPQESEQFTQRMRDDFMTELEVQGIIPCQIQFLKSHLTPSDNEWTTNV